jgi:L-serine dehydratase
MGLEGNLPDSIDPSIINHRVIDIRANCIMRLGGTRDIRFENSDLELCKTQVLPFHSNGMRFTASDEGQNVCFLSS